MIMIKKLLGALAMSLSCTLAFASVQLDKAPNRINDMAALQHGAKLFVNYCLNCHSANSMRYNKLLDLGLTEDEIKKNLLFTSDKIGELMTIAMTPADAKKWFGTTPPDLSVLARAKDSTFGPNGVDYIYTYLSTFYRDTSTKTGWNNVVFPSVSMPNVLWELEGPKTYTSEKVHKVTDDKGNSHWEKTVTKYDSDGFAKAESTKLDDYSGPSSSSYSFDVQDDKAHAEFKNAAADISNFLGWMSEPGQALRKQIGAWVLIFLFLFMFVAVRLNSSYWKHVR